MALGAAQHAGPTCSRIFSALPALGGRGRSAALSLAAGRLPGDGLMTQDGLIAGLK